MISKRIYYFLTGDSTKPRQVEFFRIIEWGFCGICLYRSRTVLWTKEFELFPRAEWSRDA